MPMRALTSQCTRVTQERHSRYTTSVCVCVCVRAFPVSLVGVGELCEQFTVCTACVCVCVCVCVCTCVRACITYLSVSVSCVSSSLSVLLDSAALRRLCAALHTD